MSLLTDIKFFLGKYLKNPVIVSAITIIVYIYLKKYLKQEGFSDNTKIIKQKGSLILFFDSKLNKYILTGGDDIYSSDKPEPLMKMMED